MSQAQGFAILCDAHGNLLEVLSDAFGLGAALQPGMPFTRLAGRGALAKALSFLNEINSQGAAFDWEINLTLAGQVKTLHLTGSLVKDTKLIVGAENGKIGLKLFEEMMQINNEQTNALRVAYKEQARDYNQYDEISRLNNELVSMQRELAKKNAELERLNQEKNRFLGMAAHDLRNPLQSILTHSAFLMDEDPVALGPDYRAFLEVICASSEFMGHLVDDLLDVAKIESGQLQLDYAPADLGALLAKNVSINRVLAAKKKIGVELITEALPSVLLDSPKLEQVLNNLIGNALKFSPPGSQVEVRLWREGGNFTLSIKDDGPGISEEEISKLFKPFQGGRKGTAGEKSTGLGLVIVKRIVEGHGGKIWLESVVGKGSTFFISIPLQPQNSKALPQEQGK